MRDPKRIDEVIGVLRDFWKDHPDLRFMQMIDNCFHRHTGEDPYGWEDDRFVARFKDVYNFEEKDE